MNARRWVPMICAAMLVAFLTPASGQEQPKTPPQPPPERPPVAQRPAPRGQLQPMGHVDLLERAPDFELDASNGRTLKLSSTRGNHLLLVFAPYKEQLATLQPYAAELAERDIQLLGVCNDKQHNLVAMARRDSLSFLMLADVTGDVSAMYGLLDRSQRLTIPGALLLDPRGVVRFIVLGHLPSPRELVSMITGVLPPP
jgi:peroxiredoxin